MPEFDTLVWNTEDFSSSELCSVLGAPLDEGAQLFPDLQSYYSDISDI